MLRIPTTRGDRLFISLLGAAFIHLAWLGLIGPGLWWASGLSLLYAAVGVPLRLGGIGSRTPSGLPGPEGTRPARKPARALLGRNE